MTLRATELSVGTRQRMDAGASKAVMISRFIVERELVEVMQPFTGRSRPFSLLYPHGRHVPLRQCAFVDFIMEKQQAWKGRVSAAG